MYADISELKEQRGCCIQTIATINSKIKSYKIAGNTNMDFNYRKRVDFVHRCYATYQTELLQIESQLESLCH